MLHFNRLAPGNYVSDCGNYAIACRSDPPEWHVYRRDPKGIFELLAIRTLLCLAKRAATEHHDITERKTDHV